MKNNYFVLYNRDRSGEQMKEAKGRMLYDKIQEFPTEKKAVAFGLNYLQNTPIVAKTVKNIDDYDAKANYVVAAYFTSKYKHYDYGGGCDPVPTHEVITCNQESLDTVIENFAKENPSKIYLGIEQKLTPTAVDRVASVNR